MRPEPITLALACAAALAIALPAHAADKNAPHDTKCVADAKELAGEERDKALADCNKPLHPQQLKMRACNAEAKTKDLHGDERRAFMSTCLKG